MTAEWIQFQIAINILETGGCSNLEHSPNMDRPVGVAYPRLPTASRSPALQCISGSMQPRLSVKPSIKAVLQTSLQNPSSLCYLHPTAFAILWTVLQVQLHGPSNPPWAPPLRLLCQSSTRAPNAVHQVLGFMPWLVLLLVATSRAARCRSNAKVSNTWHYGPLGVATTNNSRNAIVGSRYPS